jgi:F-type H+-transporting ATPase subunit alpha
VTNGFLDQVPIEKVGAWERGFLRYLEAQHSDLLDGIRTEKVLSEALEATLKEALDDFNARFEAEQGVGSAA